MNTCGLHESFDFDESKLALESIAGELWLDFKHGVHVRRDDDAITAQRLTSIEERFGFESLENALSFTKRIAVAGQHRFGKFVESVQAFLDNTGQKEVERMHSRLAETQGDSHGIMVDNRLANRLHLNGDIPKTFDKNIAEFFTVGTHMLTSQVPHASELIAKAASLIGPQYPRTSVEFRDQVEQLMKMVHSAGSPRQSLTPQMLNYVGLGGRPLFQKMDGLTSSSHAVDGHKSINDEVQDYVVFSREYRLNVQHERTLHDRSAYMPRLPIMDRQQIQSTIGLCEQLSAFIIKTMAVAKHHQKDFDGKYITGRLSANLKELRGKVVSDKANNSLIDTSQPVEHDTRKMVELLGDYFRLDLLDHLAMLETLCLFAMEMHKSLSAYVHASLNHYK